LIGGLACPQSGVPDRGEQSPFSEEETDMKKNRFTNEQIVGFSELQNQPLWWRPTQAHNGYIETYLHLGAIGLVLLGLVILSGFGSITRSFTDNLEFGRLRMGLLFPTLAFNVTEAAFTGAHVVWTSFYIGVMHVPRRAADVSTTDEHAAAAPAQVVR
jgi:O-antigen ligase